MRKAALMTDGFSGAELENVINLAALQSIRAAKARNQKEICITG